MTQKNNYEYILTVWSKLILKKLKDKDQNQNNHVIIFQQLLISYHVNLASKCSGLAILLQHLIKNFNFR